jgi:hypothetical protein
MQNLAWKARGKKPLEDAYLDGIIILKLIVKKLNWKLWTGLSWLRIGVSGGFSCVQQWLFGSNKYS